MRLTRERDTVDGENCEHCGAALAGTPDGHARDPSYVCRRCGRDGHMPTDGAPLTAKRADDPIPDNEWFEQMPGFRLSDLLPSLPTARLTGRTGT